MGIIPEDESIPWKIKGVGFDMARPKKLQCKACTILVGSLGYTRSHRASLHRFFLKLGHPFKHIECTI